MLLIPVFGGRNGEPSDEIFGAVIVSGQSEGLNRVRASKVDEVSGTAQTRGSQASATPEPKIMQL